MDKMLPPPPRFDRTARLLGMSAIEKLRDSHVVIFGMGGVGSFAAESLARSGVGNLTLVDGEKICATNINRQLHALESTIGRPKAEVMAERLREINREARVRSILEHYSEENWLRFFGAGHGLEPNALGAGQKNLGAGHTEFRVDFVVDAIDSVKAKIHLLATCATLKIPVVSAMGAAGRLDATAIRVTDLCDSHTDQFAKDVRKYLRARHGISSSKPTGIIAVWSAEPNQAPHLLPGDENGRPGVVPRTEAEIAIRRREPKCFGSASFVTGAFGMAAASVVVKSLVGLEQFEGTIDSKAKKDGRMAPSRTRRPAGWRK